MMALNWLFSTAVQQDCCRIRERNVAFPASETTIPQGERHAQVRHHHRRHRRPEHPRRPHPGHRRRPHRRHRRGPPERPGTGLHGTVKIDQAGSLTIDALGADVTIGRLTGPAEISTQKGDITVAEATGGTVKLSAQMGNVAIAAAHGVSATLDAGTGYGRINNTLLNTDGTAAALTIHATTTHGDITARSL
ncbi:hypothetical protein FHR83_002720 [Actinoplanes campanulatus]|uniref:DUF4097 domain-containing protein n=1 Tax=Actinoplanes campanulatus TaxID=113559 RepID=A0A7W5AEW7_9ACTN|nr:DUF4097 family beta strand repeat-containing protein [Actinoplanes campanulatus]MBB3095057.1 hypothetical protein [Actinoplanes campanulatus]